MQVQTGGYSCMLPAWGSLCPLTPWDSCLFCFPFLLLTAPPFPGTLEKIRKSFRDVATCSFSIWEE